MHSEVRGTFSGCAGGLIIKASPKSAAGRRILELPSWAVTMLRQRQPNDVDEDELAGQQISLRQLQVGYATRTAPSR